jgi:hypothetical protein
LALDDRKSAAKLEKMGKINTDEPYHTRGLAPRVRWRSTSRHDTPYARFELIANATPTPPTPTQTCPNATPDATDDFSFFWYFPPPKRGAGWGGGAQQQQQKSAAAAASARQGNEINTARRSNALLTCRLVVF